MKATELLQDLADMFGDISGGWKPRDHRLAARHLSTLGGLIQNQQRQIEQLTQALNEKIDGSTDPDTQPNARHGVRGQGRERTRDARATGGSPSEDSPQSNRRSVSTRFQRSPEGRRQDGADPGQSRDGDPASNDQAERRKKGAGRRTGTPAAGRTPEGERGETEPEEFVIDFPPSSITGGRAYPDPEPETEPGPDEDQVPKEEN